MNNAKVVIDAGHGGTDPGAVGNGIIEKDLTLEISNYIHNRLDELNIPNKMVRTSDETVDQYERSRRVLEAFGNGKDVLVVSNHINAGGGDGAEVIYALRNNDNFARTITEELATEGQNIRKYYQRRLPSNPAKDYYYILRNTPDTQAVIVEYGFLDSPGDDVSQLKNNWKVYAEAVVRAIVRYLGGNYVPAPGSNYYTVQNGDSLWTIARKFNTTVSELKELNNLSTNALVVGQLLKLPSENSEPNVPSNQDEYVVQNGDSLWKIANAYNTTVSELKRINNLSSDNLSVGQVLKLPTSTGNEQPSKNEYIVQNGDSLWKIANRFGTTVSALKEANQLTSDNLSVGQVLQIPGESDYQTYTVQSGDSLYKIAKNFQTTVNKLKDINNLSSDVLMIGQKLLVPIV